MKVFVVEIRAIQILYKQQNMHMYIIIANMMKIKHVQGNLPISAIWRSTKQFKNRQSTPHFQMGAT